MKRDEKYTERVSFRLSKKHMKFLEENIEYIPQFIRSLIWEKYQKTIAQRR